MALQPSPGTTAAPKYLVVARRYRPQSFSDLVGQESAARALSNAIASQRIGHAYLFTGARGVGKTSTARIFAKSLNCVEGPTSEPCQRCDPCLGIAEGSDVDVLEIDGASNRGIDEIRQLRSSVGVRPSRARFKIYIIDEVHMLTREAFNALLKTLEEPPGHVKFIFCTTSPEKIPITVLSRCQRFDFPPIEMTQILVRLAEIVAQEGASAEPAALELLARRAAGSMRDSQSLLEQVLAFCGSEVTCHSVQQMLGIASSQRVLEILESLQRGDPVSVLGSLDQAIHEGVDAGQLAEQLLGSLRDTLVMALGAPPDLLLHSALQDVARLQTIGQAWGPERLLASAQIIDQGLVRMRQSVHSRTLLELSLLRIARLEQLDTLASLVQQVKRLPELPTVGQGNVGGIGSGPQRAATPTVPPPTKIAEKKNVDSPARDVRDEPPLVEPSVERTPSEPVPAWTEELARSTWQEVLEEVPGMVADFARRFESVTVGPPNRMVVFFASQHSAHKHYCERTDKRQILEEALRVKCGLPVRLEFQLRSEPQPDPKSAQNPRATPRLTARDMAKNEFVRTTMDLFQAEVSGVDLPKERS